MQGVLPDGAAFLVSGFSSSRWYSEALLEEADGATSASLPPKACRALALLLETVNGGMALEQANGRLTLEQADGGMLLEKANGKMAGKLVRLRSNIPPGKRLSSSSTDVLSVLSVVNRYLGAGLSPLELYAIAARVDPTDPCLSDDIVLFHQHSGVCCRSIGLPPMSLFYFDAAPGRVIDTETIRRPWTSALGKYFDWLLSTFLRAAEEGDYDGLFESITYSAEYNQTVIAMPRFDDYLRLARETRSGLMVAHSGTIMGLLTRPEQGAELRARVYAMTDEPIYSEHYIPSLFSV
jgi:uncharacterized protein involved in propanediol utilization